MQPRVDSVQIYASPCRGEIVRSMVERAAPLSGEIIQLQRMGDEAVVALVNVFGAKAALTDPEKYLALAILQQTYSRPDAILDFANTYSRATIFPANYLSASSKHREITDKVSTLKNRLSHTLPLARGNDS